MITDAVPLPNSLPVMKLCTFAGGLALAWQVKVVLSYYILSEFKVRVLVNDDLEPDTEEIVTSALLLDKGVLPLSQMTSVSMMTTSVSVARLMEMLQVRVRGVVLPANSGSGGTVMITSGVETWRDSIQSSEM